MSDTHTHIPLSHPPRPPAPLAGPRGAKPTTEGAHTCRAGVEQTTAPGEDVCKYGCGFAHSLPCDAPTDAEERCTRAYDHIGEHFHRDSGAQAHATAIEPLAPNLNSP